MTGRPRRKRAAIGAQPAAALHLASAADPSAAPWLLSHSRAAGGLGKNRSAECAFCVDRTASAWRFAAVLAGAGSCRTTGL